MDSSDSFSARLTISPKAYMFLLYGFRLAEEGLSSSEPYYACMSLPLYRGILRQCFPSSSCLPWSSPLTPRLDFPSVRFRGLFLTIRQNSLDVTTCILASTLSDTLPSRFTRTISATHGDWLLGLLGNYPVRTFTGSMVQLVWTHG